MAATIRPRAKPIVPYNDPNLPDPMGASPPAAPEPGATPAPTTKIPWNQMNPGQRLATLFGAGPNVAHTGKGLFGVKESDPQVPTPPDVGGITEAGRQEITPRALEEAHAEYESARGTQGRAIGLAHGSQEQVSEEERRRDQETTLIGRSQAQTDVGLREQLASADALPEEVTAAMSKITDDFKASIAGNVGDIKAMGADALADITKGQSAAISAATVGMQNQIHTQVAQIQSNPDIPAAQKQQMISQVKMQGAMSIMPAVGSTVVAFQQMRTATNNNTINAVSSILSTATSAEGSLAGAQSGVIGASYTASKELGAKLTEDRAANREWGTQARITNDAARQAAIQFGDTFQASMLPAEADPVLYTSPIFIQDTALRVSAVQTDFQNALRSFGMNEMQAMAKQQGKSDFWQMILGGFAQGGISGGLMGLAGGLAMGGPNPGGV